MGEKLLKYYKYMSDEKGIAGKMCLAKETKMPSQKAALEPDSPQNIEMFINAVENITKKAAPRY